jgi:hypothetical protein
VLRSVRRRHEERDEASVMRHDERDEATRRGWCDDEVRHDERRATRCDERDERHPWGRTGVRTFCEQAFGVGAHTSVLERPKRF